MVEKIPNLPHKNQITFQWLLDHVPISWWALVLTSVAAVFSAGLVTAKISFNNLDGDILDKISVKEKLQVDIQDLESKKRSLNAQVIGLQIERDVLKMSVEERRERLKKNLTRD